MRILGIDPGTRITGWGCVEGDPDHPRLVEAGVFRLAGSRPPPLPTRLVELHADVTDLIASLDPDAVAMEGLFSHYKHPATAIVMGHARGVLMLAIQKAGLPLVELKPAEVKKSLVGHGRAGKRQIQETIRDQFALPELPEPPDVADALAVALCALRRPPIEVASRPVAGRS